MIDKLNSDESIDIAYLDPGPIVPPVVNASDDPRSSNQGYLNTAPEGIDAHCSWTISGGDGEGIQFVDLEQGWTLNHEDLIDKRITIISGISKTHFGHGTAVLGEVVAVDNNMDGVGIAPNVSSTRVVSQWSTPNEYVPVADAIVSAVNELNYGDVLLLEAQTEAVVGSGNFFPVEIHDAEYEAIRLATANGIVVIEPAGNGGNDLDNFQNNSGQRILNRDDPGFRGDSGAIMVGASTSTIPHARTHESNFGSRVDCYGWGENIDTAGDGQNGTARNEYTRNFGGTSGASAIITGATLCVQGISQSRLSSRFSPAQIRTVLSDTRTGTPSKNPNIDRIGIMPNLRAIINSTFGITVTISTPPQNFTAIGRSTSIDLRWSSPSNTGGVPIDRYEIERTTSPTTGWSSIVSMPGNLNRHSDNGLLRRTRYWYRLRAINSVGASNFTKISAKTGDCFIATAAYGSELEPHVSFLREFRDNVVLQSRYGNFFKMALCVYYNFSPLIADLMYCNKPLRCIIKYSVVWPFVMITKAVAHVTDLLFRK